MQSDQPQHSPFHHTSATCPVAKVSAAQQANEFGFSGGAICGKIVGQTLTATKVYMQVTYAIPPPNVRQKAQREGDNAFQAINNLTKGQREEIKMLVFLCLCLMDLSENTCI